MIEHADSYDIYQKIGKIEAYLETIMGYSLHPTVNCVLSSRGGFAVVIIVWNQTTVTVWFAKEEGSKRNTFGMVSTVLN